MPEKSQENTGKSSTTNASSLSLLTVVLSFFFIGSLYTRVKFLEKEIADYKENSKVAGAQVEAKVNDAVPQPPQQPSGNTSEIKGEVKITANDHINGDKNARILLIEYSDMECPFCKKFHPTAQQIVDSYKGEVAWIYRHLPLPFHANASKEAESSECANELGGNSAFWKFVNALYTKTNSGGTGYALADLAPLAKEVGLNEAKFQVCIDSGKYADRVTNDSISASALGVSGTPGNILLDTKTGKTKLIAGAYPFEEFKTVIDEMLAN